MGTEEEIDGIDVYGTAGAFVLASRHDRYGILTGLLREILTFVSTTPLPTFGTSGQGGPGLTKAIEIAQIVENLGFPGRVGPRR